MLGDGLEVLDREAFGEAAKVSLQVAQVLLVFAGNALMSV